METTKSIWMDGKLVDWDQAKIHVLCHSLHYGLGVFEGIRFYETPNGPAIFRLKEHTQRLLKGAQTAFMKVPYSEEELIEATKETVKVNEIKSGYIRPLIYYGYGKMGLNPEGAPVNTSIAVWGWGSYLGDDAVKVKTSDFIRLHPKSTHADTKISGHYYNSIFASVEAKEAGYDEALLLDFEGNVAEGPGENLFIINDGKISTPSLGNILPGITRDAIMTLAKENGIEVEERTITKEDVYNSDEAFFTGTAAEVTPIKSLDDNELKEAPGPITQKLKDQFMDIVKGKTDKHQDWLTLV